MKTVNKTNSIPQRYVKLSNKWRSDKIQFIILNENFSNGILNIVTQCSYILISMTLLSWYFFAPIILIMKTNDLLVLKWQKNRKIKALGIADSSIGCIWYYTKASKNHFSNCFKINKNWVLFSLSTARVISFLSSR